MVAMEASAAPSGPGPWWREPTKKQWFGLGAAYLGWMFGAFDFTLFLLVIPTIAKHFGVSLAQTALAVTLTLLARLGGGLLAGIVADKWGRKLPLLIAIAWFSMASGAMSLAPSFGWVVALRVLYGLGLGGQWTSGTALVMENWPERSRGLASGLLQGAWAIGYLAACLVTRLVVGGGLSWRVLFALSVFPVLLVLPVQRLVDEPSARAKTSTQPRLALWQPALRRPLLWAAISLSAGMAAYFALASLYAAALQTEHGLSVGASAARVMLFNVGMLVGTVVFGTLSRRIGVHWAVALPALAMLPCLPLYVGMVPSLLALGALAGGLFGIGWVGIAPLYLSGLFPTEIRARCMGLAYHVGACLSALAPPLVTFVARRLDGRALHPLSWAIAIVSGVYLFSLAMLFLLQPRDLAVKHDFRLT